MVTWRRVAPEEAANGEDTVAFKQVGACASGVAPEEAANVEDTKAFKQEEAGACACGVAPTCVCRMTRQQLAAAAGGGTERAGVRPSPGWESEKVRSTFFLSEGIRLIW